MYSSSIRCPSAPEHWSVFCFAETSCATISAGPAAQPSRTPGRNVLEVVPAWTTTSGASDHRRRQRSVAEVELAVGDVLDDEEAVAARKLDERLAPLGRERHAGRVLVVGDRVEELRPQAVRRAAPLELVDLEPVLVHRHGHDLGLEPAEGHDRAEIRRRLDEHRVAAVEERLADQLERLDPAARDQQLVVAGPPVPAPLEPSGDGVERARQPARRRVLECGRLAARGELGEQLPPPGSRGNVSGSGKPPANEIRSGRPRNPSTNAMPSPTSPRVLSAKSASQRPVSGVTAIGRP